MKTQIINKIFYVLILIILNFKVNHSFTQWMQVPNGNFNFLSSDVTSCLQVENKFFIGTQQSGLFFSNDLGVTWTKDLNLNQTSIKFIQQIGNYIIVSTNGGLFKSTDEGETWSDFNSGIEANPNFPDFGEV